MLYEVITLVEVVIKMGSVSGCEGGASHVDLAVVFEQRLNLGQHGSRLFCLHMINDIKEYDDIVRALCVITSYSIHYTKLYEDFRDVG